MQKLEKRNTYIPTSTPHACSSMTMSLNRDESLSKHSLKTFSNNLEVGQHRQTDGHKVKVFVINKNGEPLMPCKPAKARHLLKEKKATVISRKPFTIKLDWSCEKNIQKISLGIDAGAKTIGFSAVSSNKELISGEYALRTDMSKKLTARSLSRRERRSRLWHRKPRYMNRSNAKTKGTLPPSIQHKVDTHIRLIKKIKSILPISKTIVEVAQFDTQKLQNADIKGTEYQEGQMQEYDNLRAFIFSRDNHTCQICKKRGGIMDIHHIIPKKNGGSNRPNNLVCLHSKCHKKLHSGKINHTFKKPKQFKETTVMNNIWSRVVNKLNCDYTFGHITKRERIEQGLDKTHYDDAFIIAGGSTQERVAPYLSKQGRRNNRKLQFKRKGSRPSIRKTRYPIQPGDLIKYNSKLYRTRGCHSKGRYIQIFLNNKWKSIKFGQFKLICYNKGINFFTIHNDWNQYGEG